MENLIRELGEYNSSKVFTGRHCGARSTASARYGINPPGSCLELPTSWACMNYEHAHAGSEAFLSFALRCGSAGANRRTEKPHRSHGKTLDAIPERLADMTIATIESTKRSPLILF